MRLFQSLSAMCLLTLSALPSMAAQAVVETGRTEPVALRSGPADAFEVERLLRDGTVVDILSTDPADLWVEVRAPNGATGWLPQSALRDPDQIDDTPLRRDADRPDWIRRDASDGQVASAAATARETLYVNSPSAGALNLRSGPGTDYAVMAQLDHGAEVAILGGGAPWRRVRSTDGQVGYVYDSYLSADAPALSPPAAPDAIAQDRLWVDAPRYGALNLRAGPGTQYAIRETMPQGSRVDVIGTAQGDWLQLRSANGQTGYAHRDYLSADRPAQRSIARSDRVDTRERNVIRVTPDELPRLLAVCAFSGESFERCVARQKRR